jgi:hypothetical protein
VAEPVVAFIGFISIPIDGGLFLNVGNFVEKLLVC